MKLSYISLFLRSFCEKISEMSDTEVTSTSLPKENSENNYRRNQQSNGRYYNEKMLICMASGFTTTDLAEELHNLGHLKAGTGIRPFEFGRRIAVVVEDEIVRDKPFAEGMHIQRVFVTFLYHKRRPLYRVHVYNLPIGVPSEEIRKEFNEYGDIYDIERQFKLYHDVKLDTGERVITYSKILKNIPSYVPVRGWNAYVYHYGQQRTFTICSEPDHFAKDCPRNRRPEDTPMDQQSTAEETNKKAKEKTIDMDILEPPRPNAPSPKDPGQPNACQEILENLEPFENASLANITVEDCQVPSSPEKDAQQDATKPEKQSQAWADSTDEIGEVSVAGSEKPQEAPKQKPEEAPQVKPKTYCPVCTVDSHSEEQCGRVTFLTLSKVRGISG